MSKLLYCSSKLSSLFTLTKTITSTSVRDASHSCKLLVVGGGTGGCAIAAKFAKTMSKNNLIVLEPSSDHYYQPLFTLVGGGTHTTEDARRNTESVLPKNCTWMKDRAIVFDPKNNKVTTGKGDIIEYDYLVIAVGLDLRYDKIPGLIEALKQSDGRVCSNYSPMYVTRTYPALQNLRSGNAIFTYPNCPIKCAGAPQKICYIADAYLRKMGRRNNINIVYNTSLPVIFGVKRYADALWKVCQERNITVNLSTNLISVNSDKAEATFQTLTQPQVTTTMTYEMLHVTPPQSTPEILSKNKDLTNDAGFVDVNKHTLQHVRFPNIFALGDCASTPNSKTAAAASAQSVVLHNNLKSLMKNAPLLASYDGYASCPLVTGYDKCILAEFDYDLNPLETFPFRQDRELYSMYLLKRNVIPHIYWQLMMKGLWNGPESFRKVMHLNFRNGTKEKKL